MKLNIIYDARRFEKYEPLMLELERQGIKEGEFEIWPCLLLNDVVSAINKSHKMIVEDAKEKGLSEVCICEDDLFFPAQDGWQYFLRNKPLEYDIYVAATYILPVELKKLCGFHLYCVSSKFYDTFLSTPNNVHIDTYFDTIPGDYHICYPYAALQRPGFSSNNKAYTNYNAILKDEHVYGGIPK